jgi:hypothetical protein
MHWKTRLRLRLIHRPTLERLTARLLPRFDRGLRLRRTLSSGSPGPSGPFGEASDGCWVSWGELERSWRRWFPSDETRFGGLWFDLHASRTVS